MSGVASSVMMPVAASVRYAHRRPRNSAASGDDVALCSNGFFHECAVLPRQPLRRLSRYTRANRAIVHADDRHHIGGRSRDEELVDLEELALGECVLPHGYAE